MIIDCLSFTEMLGNVYGSVYGLLQFSLKSIYHKINERTGKNVASNDIQYDFLPPEEREKIFLTQHKKLFAS